MGRAPPFPICFQLHLERKRKKIININVPTNFIIMTKSSPVASPYYWIQHVLVHFDSKINFNGTDIKIMCSIFKLLGS